MAVPATLALVALLSAGAWLFARSARIERARRALPEIARLDAEDDNVAAFRLARQVLPYLAGDAEAQRLWESLTFEYSVDTEPEGADVSWKSYGEPESAWEALGPTPIQNVRLTRLLATLADPEAGVRAGRDRPEGLGASRRSCAPRAPCRRGWSGSPAARRLSRARPSSGTASGSTSTR